MFEYYSAEDNSPPLTFSYPLNILFFGDGETLWRPTEDALKMAYVSILVAAVPLCL